MRKNQVSEARKSFSNVNLGPVIGKGQFSVCFAPEATNQSLGDVAYIVSRCPMKECVARDWMPVIASHVSFPDSEIVDRDFPLTLYKMPIYITITAPKKQLSKKAYAFYQELRIISAKLSSLVKLWDKQKYLVNMEKSKAVESVLACLEACANYTDEPCFEISPRNIATNENGDLILLDCFFDRKLINRK